MLIYSMSVSVDGFIADREGAFGWSASNAFLGGVTPGAQYCAGIGQRKVHHLFGHLTTA